MSVLEGGGWFLVNFDILNMFMNTCRKFQNDNRATA